MASRASLNKVLLIGNLTRDPELRYTPSGAAVCTFGVATNRTYVASDGTKKEEAEFIKIVSWNKLAELCSQLLSKGRKVYVEGRLQTRSWETPDGQNRQTTEVVIDDMRILDSKKSWEEGAEAREESRVPEDAMPKPQDVPQISDEPRQGRGSPEAAKKADEEEQIDPKKSKKTKAENSDEKEVKVEEDKLDLDDLPF